MADNQHDLRNKAGDKSVKVALWCAPRSASTVFTKCLAAIEGINVYLEIYSYATSCRGIFSTSKGCNLPMALDGNEAVYQEANDIWEKAMSYRLTPRRMSYATIQEDLEKANNRYILAKEMAVNSIPPEYLPNGFKHAFLIRDPSRVFGSARKVAAPTMAKSGLIPSENNYDLIRDDPTKSEPLLWFEKQHTLWKYVKENIDPHPVVIDAFDLLSNPGPMLKAFCEAVGFPFSDQLLEWQPTTEMPGNFVAASESVFKEMSLFYKRAFESTHFEPPSEGGPLPRDQLTDDVIRCVDHSTPFYREMYKERLLPS